MKKVYLLTALLAIFALRLQAQDIFEKMHEPWKYSFNELKQSAEDFSKEREKNKFGKEEKEDGPFDEIVEPLLYDYQLHQNKDGRFINFTGATWNAYYQYINKYPADLQTTQNGDWSFIGPTHITGGKYGIGRVNTLEIISTNTWLAGAAGGGLWKTSDGGVSWKCLTDGLPDIAVSDIAVNPANSNIIYILTGDGDFQKFPSIGVLKTTDGGATWKTTGLSWNLDDVVYGHKLIMDPKNSNILWAATSNGIYRTVNGAAIWDTVSSGAVKKNIEYFDIEFMPGNSNRIYAATKNEILYNLDYPASVFKQAFVTASSSCIRVELAVTPADANYVYAVFVNKNKGLDGVYQSVNSGISFTGQCDGDPNYLAHDSPYKPEDGGQGNYDLALLADPLDKNAVFLAGIHLFRSADHAQTFSRVDADDGQLYVHGDYHWVAWNGSNLVTGTDGGVWQSNSSFTTFIEKNQGLDITQYFHLGVDPFNSANFGGGAQDMGITLTKNNNTDFDHAVWRDGMQVIYYPGQQNVIVASVQNASISISTDGGATFNPNSPDPGADAEKNAPLILTKDNIFYSSVEGALYKGVYPVFSKIKWFPVNEKDGMVFHKFAQLASGVSNTNRFYGIYQSGFKGYLLRSDDMNSSTPDFKNPNTTDYSSQLVHSSYIEVDPLNSSHLYITFSGYSIAHHVWESNDSGETFHFFSGTLPDVPVYCAKADGSSNHGIYIGTEVGVFYRNDDLNDWVFYSNGMPVVQVRELAIIPSINKLRAATYGRGFWESVLYGGCKQNITITKNNYKLGNDYELASGTVISTAIIAGSTGNNVTYNAGNYIRLDTGFESKSGAEFHAFIEGCDLSSAKKIVTGIYTGSVSLNSDLADGIFKTAEVKINRSPKASLEQNIPNPFSNSTSIGYTLPQKFTTAQIMITDKNGKTLKMVNVSGAGKGKINVDASILASGAYNYSLLVDGKLIGTKQMILTK